MRDDTSQSRAADTATPDAPSGAAGAPACAPILLALRSAVGGVLMGLANLVPGISGGTMLVAAGIYTRFINAIAELTMLRFRFRSILVLGSVVIAAFAVISLLAGRMADIVTARPMVMFSVFIGLTLGGVPVLKQMLGRGTRPAWVAGVVTFAAMGALAYVQSFRAPSGNLNEGFVFMLVAGVVAAAAMILPGVSGGYMFLLLGVYVPILRAIEQLTDALRARDMAAISDPLLTVVVPVAIGVIIGVIAVSNALRWLLARHRKATLGALMGLLIGAVIGLWPFQATVPLDRIERIKGRNVYVLDEALMFEVSGEPVAAEDYPTRPRWPSGAGEAASSLGLIVAGFAFTAILARLGREKSGA